MVNCGWGSTMREKKGQWQAVQCHTQTHYYKAFARNGRIFGSYSIANKYS